LILYNTVSGFLSSTVLFKVRNSLDAISIRLLSHQSFKSLWEQLNITQWSTSCHYTSLSRFSHSSSLSSSVFLYAPLLKRPLLSQKPRLPSLQDD
jgi:hypothetical protein